MSAEMWQVFRNCLGCALLWILLDVVILAFNHGGHRRESE